MSGLLLTRPWITSAEFGVVPVHTNSAGNRQQTASNDMSGRAAGYFT